MSAVIRDFDIISFLVRNGKPCRLDHQARKYTVLDNIPGEIARIAAGQVAQGRYVIVMESGSLKSDYCRLRSHARHALETMTEDEYIKFFRNVEPMRGMRLADWRGHLVRSVPA